MNKCLDIKYTMDDIKFLYSNYLKMKTLAYSGNFQFLEIALDLERFLNILNTEEKQMITLLVINGMDYRTYASKYNTNIATISYKLNNALKKVIDIYGES